MVKNIARYSTNAQAIRSVSTRQIAARAYPRSDNFKLIIITSIILLSANYILPLVADSKFGNAIAALTTIVVISPLALSLRRVAAEQVDALYKEKIQRAYIYDDLFRMG
jgi:CPA2 family monovalent cation:H+ antiporter-2